MKLFFHLSLIVSFMGIVSCQKKITKESESFVAVITTKINSVFYKKAKTFEWRGVESNQKVDNFDSVRTDENSHAKIDFVDGGALDVEENSLVLILDKFQKREKIEQNVALPKGRVEGIIPKGKNKVELLIKTPNGWIRAKNNKGKVKFKVDVDKEKTKIKVIKGNIKLEVKDRKHELPEGKEAVLNTDSSKQESEYHKSPAQAEIVLEKVKIIEVEEVKNIFKLTSPSKMNYSTSDESVHFKGHLEGKYKVFLNGELLKPVDGKIHLDVLLRSGLNIFTFQIVLNQRVSYKIYKIVKK